MIGHWTDHDRLTSAYLNPTDVDHIDACVEVDRAWRLARRDQIAFRTVAPRGVNRMHRDIQRVGWIVGGMAMEWIIWAMTRAGIAVTPARPGVYDYQVTPTDIERLNAVLHQERTTQAGALLVALTTLNIVGQHRDGGTLIDQAAGTMPRAVLDDYTARCRDAYLRNRARR